MVPRRLHNSGGFTLLELILALTVIAMIAAILVVSVRLAVSSQQVGDRKSEMYQRLRFIGEQLTEKIRSANPVYLMNGEERLFANLNQDRAQGKRILAFEGSPDSVRFITTSPRLQDTDERAPDLHEVRFFLGKNPKTNERGVILMERPLSHQTALRDTPETLEEATFVTLARNVARLKFRYLQVKAEGETLPGETTKTVKYLKEWVDTVNTEPIEFLGQSGTALFQRAVGAAGQISLPRAIEVSLGLYEKPVAEAAEDSEAAKRVLLPTVVIPVQTGLVFERAAPAPPPESEQVKS